MYHHWEFDYILTASLFNPLMKAGFDLVEDNEFDRSIAGNVEDTTLGDRANHMRYAREYYNI